MKRKLRLFADYVADSPLWEDVQQGHYRSYPEDEYNKTEDTLRSFGVSDRTLCLMQTLMYVFEHPSVWLEEPPEHYAKAYEGLLYVVKEHLEKEIGDKFEIEVVL